MKRQEFIKKSLLTIGATLPLLSLVGCGGEDDGDDVVAEASCVDFGTESAIGSNHGHDLIVSTADVNSEIPMTYRIQGSSAHNHTVTITAEQFAELRSGNTIRVDSTTDESHSHRVTVSCANA